jgi:O-methyltransferase
MPIEPIADRVIEERLTYLSREKFGSLYDAVDQIERETVAGDFVELGVALGGSGICLATALGADRRFVGFDVFEMIPPPSVRDGEDVLSRYEAIKSGNSAGIGGDLYYGYTEQLMDVVKASFARFGCAVDGDKVQLVQGLFAETLVNYCDLTVALAHIDCDWYDPVKLCLSWAWTNLEPGGLIILDDYNDWSGCQTATDEFLGATPSAQVMRLRPHAVIRKPV